jgi:hypothetical protein
LLRRRRILLHHTVARDSFANVLRFVGNFFQMNGCVRDYAVRMRGAFGFFARVRANKLLPLPEAAMATRPSPGRAWLRVA